MPNAFVSHIIYEQHRIGIVTSVQNRAMVTLEVPAQHIRCNARHPCHKVINQAVADAHNITHPACAGQVWKRHFADGFSSTIFEISVFGFRYILLAYPRFEHSNQLV